MFYITFLNYYTTWRWPVFSRNI